MSSLFDTEFDTDVYNRRNHTPWANISLTGFAKEMAVNGGEADANEARRRGLDPRYFYSGENDFVLIVQSRPSVSSRFWFTVKWTSADGQRYEQSAQYLDLCLWRAAQTELDIEKAVGRK